MDDSEVEDRAMSGDTEAPVEYPVTERVRIVGAQPATGITPQDEAEDTAGEPDARPDTAAPIGAVVPPDPLEDGGSADGWHATGGAAADMPHWTDPPTGQVPAILDRGRDTDDPWSAVLGGGPAWREHPHEWEDVTFEPALLADEGGLLGGDDTLGWTADGRQDPTPAGPDPGDEPSPPSAGVGDGAADDGSVWDAVRAEEPAAAPGGAPTGEPGAPGGAPTGAPGAEAGSIDAETGEATGDGLRWTAGRGARRSATATGRRRGRAPAPHPERGTERADAATAPEGEPSRRSVPLAIGTGLVVALVALFCMAAGPRYVMILATVVVVMAAAELYGALHRAGHRPATLVGLVGTLAVMVAAYTKGVGALPLVTVLVVVTTMLWYLFGIGRGSPLQGIGVTVVAFTWVGLFGSFASLLLAPGLFPDRHGVAFIFGAIAAVVANDVGALAVGSWLGRHPLARAISPHKTWEGAVGGAVLTLIVSILLTGHVHPWTPGKAAVLGIVVSVIAPIGDLCESLVKRELGIKDMGSVLPGHGGVLDRFDALLFVLPATFYLVRAFHLG